MKRGLTALLVLALLLPACQPLSSIGVSTSPAPTTPRAPAELPLTWPLFGEVVDAAPVLQWAGFPGATHYQVRVLDSGSAAVRVDQDTSEPQLAVAAPLPKGAGYT